MAGTASCTSSASTTIEGTPAHIDIDALEGEILSTDGVGALTTTNLCARLDVTRGSLYHHFANKKELYHAVVEDAERAHGEQLQSLGAGGLLRSVVLAFVKDALIYIVIFTAILYLPTQLGGQLRGDRRRLGGRQRDLSRLRGRRSGRQHRLPRQRSLCRRPHHR